MAGWGANDTAISRSSSRGWGANDVEVSQPPIGGWGTNDVEVGISPAAVTSNDHGFDGPQPIPLPIRERTWGEVGQDITASIAKGGVEFARGANELSRYLPSTMVGNAVAGAITGKPNSQDIVEKDLLKPASDYWQDNKSAPQKARQSKVNDAKGFSETTSALLENPSVIASIVGEQAIPMMLQMGVSGKVAQLLSNTATREAAIKTAGAVGLGFESLQSAGGSAVEVRDHIKSMKPSVLRENEAYKVFENQFGESIAKERFADLVAPVAGSLSGIATATIGRFMGDHSRIGRMVAGESGKGFVGRSVSAARTTAGEGLSEMAQEPAEQLGSDLGKRYGAGDNSVNPFDLNARGKDMAMGLIGGIGQGGTMHLGGTAIGAMKGDAANQQTTTPNPSGPESPNVLALPSPVIQVDEAGRATTSEQRNTRTANVQNEYQRLIDNGFEPGQARQILAAQMRETIEAPTRVVPEDIADAASVDDAIATAQQSLLTPQEAQNNAQPTQTPSLDEVIKQAPVPPSSAIPVTPIDANVQSFGENDVEFRAPVPAPVAPQETPTPVKPEGMATRAEAQAFIDDQRKRGGSVSGGVVQLADGSFGVRAGAPAEPAKRTPVAIPEDQITDAIQKGDVTLSSGAPFQSARTAALRQRTTPGDIVQVPGGWVLRPTQNAQTQAKAVSTPIAAPAAPNPVATQATATAAPVAPRSIESVSPIARQQSDVALTRSAPQETVKPERFPKVESLEDLVAGPSSITPRNAAPGVSLYRQTNVESLDGLLRDDGRPSISNIFVTDDKALAIGQGGNKGVVVKFRPDSVSGRENKKPGTGVIGGKEFRADMLAPRAIESIEFSNALEVLNLSKLARRFLSQEFDKVSSKSGVEYRRKGAPASSETKLSIDAAPEQAQNQKDVTPRTNLRVSDSSSSTTGQGPRDSAPTSSRAGATQSERNAAEPARATERTGSDKPASLEDSRVAAQMEARVQRSYPDAKFSAVGAPTGANAQAFQAAKTVAKRLFGKDAVFVKFEGDALFQGAMSDVFPDKVFINVDATKPYMAVLGHELLHQVRLNTPDVYNQLSERLNGLIQNESAYAKDLAARYEAKGGKLPANWMEELHADIVGDNFTTPEFWQEMAKDQPSTFQKIADVIKSFLNRVLVRSMPFGTQEYLKDVRAARAAVADAMRQFSGAQVGAVAEPVSNDVSFSIDGKTPVGRAIDAVKTHMDAPGTISWWHKTVGTMFNLSERSPEFKRVFDSVQSFLGDVSQYATQAADKAPTVLPKLESIRDIARSPVSAEDTKAFSAPVFEGTLSWGRNESGKAIKMEDLRKQYESMPTEEKAQKLLRRDAISEGQLKSWQALPIASYEGAINNRFDAEFLAEGVVWSDAELKSNFNLTPQQVKMYREFRAATDESLTRLGISDMLRIGGEDTAPLRDTVIKMTSATEAAETLRDYLLSVAEGSPRNDVLVDTANVMIDKADKIASLIEHGYAPLSRFGEHTLDVVDKDGERVYFGLFESPGEANKMATKLRAQHPGAKVERGTTSQEQYKLFSGVSPETVELFGEMLGLESGASGEAHKAFQQFIKLAKSNRSAMKRMIERKGIAGFSEDAGRVLAGFVYSNARQVAKNLHMQEMTKAASDIPKGQGQLQDMAIKLTEYIKNPQEEAQAIRGLLFAQYIGGSLASAMVNLTQPFVVTMPYLSQYGGMTKAANQMRKATADVWRKSTGDAKLDAALKQAANDGVVAPQEVHQLMAQAMGRGTLQSGDGTLRGNAMAKLKNASSKTALAWGQPFALAELMNRRITYIAAYRTAMAKGGMDPDTFARDTINQTQFINNRGDKPMWARGSVGATLFTFKKYGIAYVELLNRLATRNGPEGKKAALWMVGMLFMLGGVKGLPFMGDLEDGLEFIMGKLGYDFSSKNARRKFLQDNIGKMGAQFVEGGVSGLPGAPIDISGRLGMGNLIPGTGLLTAKKDHGDDVAEIGGAAADFVKRGLQSGDALASGDLKKAGLTMAPTAIRNLAKAYEMYSTGMYKDAGGNKVIDVDGYDAISKGIGFQPNAVAKVQEASAIETNLVTQHKMKEADIVKKWSQGIVEGDSDKVQDARDDLASWNEKNADLPIRVNAQQIFSRVKNMRRSKEQRIGATAPKEIRGAVQRQLAEDIAP